MASILKTIGKGIMIIPMIFLVIVVSTILALGMGLKTSFEDPPKIILGMSLKHKLITFLVLAVTLAVITWQYSWIGSLSFLGATLLLIWGFMTVLFAAFMLYERRPWRALIPQRWPFGSN